MRDRFMADGRRLPGALAGPAALIAALLCSAPVRAQTEPAPLPAPAPAPEAAPVPAEAPVPAPAPEVAAAPTTAPAESYAFPVPPRKTRPKRGLLIAGAATLGGGYLFTVLVGALLYQADSDPTTECLNCDAAWKMFIPLVGPFVFLPDADGTDGKVVCAVMGGVQVIGLGLLVAGIAHVAAQRRRIEEAGSGFAASRGRIDFGVSMARDGTPTFGLRF